MVLNYLNCVTASGTYGAVFESTKDGAMYYLLEMQKGSEPKIVTYIPIWTGARPAGIRDLKILPSSDDSVLGLFIDDVLWAAFDTVRMKRSGGHYRQGSSAAVSPEICEKFST